MDRVARRLAGALRCLSVLLSEHRRGWVHALLAEADDQPTPSGRLAWLGGGLWLVTREVLMNRLIQVLTFVAGAVGLVLIAWPGASTNSATPVNRMYVVGILVLLAVLPPLVRRYVGPVRAGWTPRLVRAGGYGVVLALIAATAVQQRIGSRLGAYFPVIVPVWAIDVGFLLILAGYVSGLLILTSRRVQFTRRVLPVALGIGALTAGVLYALAPFGINDTAETASHSLHGGRIVVTDYLILASFALAALAVPVAVHAAATRLADRDSQPAILSPARQALLATGGAMATAAMLVALFTTLTIALWPHHVNGLHQAANDGSCPTCETRTIVIPVNLRQEYSFEDSVNGAGDGAIALLAVPLIGAALGGLRGLLRYGPTAKAPESVPAGA